VKRKTKQRGRSRKTNRQDASRPTIEQQRTQASSDEAGRSNGSEDALPAFSVEDALAELNADGVAELGELPPKRQAFVLAYTGLAGFNGAKAARMAGYSERSARAIASELLTFPDVKAAIDARMKELAMKSNELLARLAAIARADISPYLRSNGHSMYFDLEQLKADGLGFLIKEAWDTADGMHLKAQDSLAALTLLAKIQGLLVDRTFNSDVSEDFDLEVWREERRQRRDAVESLPPKPPEGEAE
jgi:hypothetical protein